MLCRLGRVELRRLILGRALLGSMSGERVRREGDVQGFKTANLTSSPRFSSLSCTFRQILSMKVGRAAK